MPRETKRWEKQGDTWWLFNKGWQRAVIYSLQGSRTYEGVGLIGTGQPLSYFHGSNRRKLQREIEAAYRKWSASK